MLVPKLLLNLLDSTSKMLELAEILLMHSLKTSASGETEKKSKTDEDDSLIVLCDNASNLKKNIKKVNFN